MVTADKVQLLIGRSIECSFFEARLDDAKRRDGSTAVLRGEAGMGKTRLVHHWMGMAREAGFRVVLVTNFPSIREPYAPLAEACRSLAKSERRALPNSSEERNLFARFVNFAASPGADAAPWQKRRIFVVVHDFLERLAAYMPVLIVIEDVQWSDPDSLELLQYLATRLGGVRMVLAITVRETVTGPAAVYEAVDALERAATTYRIAIGPLSRSETREFVLSLLPPGRKVKQRTVEAICERSEGTPLFAEDLIKGVLSDGSAQILPQSIERSVQSRLNGLTAGAIAILEAAAVNGPVIDVPMLRELLSLEASTESAVFRAARDLGFIVDGKTAHEMPRFRHDLIREAIYLRLTEVERRSWHERIALLLERDASTTPERLARHWKGAGDARRTAIFAERAADVALAHFASATARDHLLAALETNVLDAASIARVSEKLGRVSDVLGSAQAAYDAFSIATAYYEGAEDTESASRLSLRLANAAYRLASFDSAVRHCNDVIASTDENHPARYSAYVLLATFQALYAHTDQAAQNLAQADAFCGPSEPDYEIRHWVARALVAHLQGRTTEAHAAVATAVERAEVYGDSMILANCCTMLADLARWRADFALAETGLERAIGVADASALTYTSVFARLTLADMMALRGSLKSAHELVRFACALAVEGTMIRFYAAAIGIPIAIAVDDNHLIEHLADKELLKTVLETSSPEAAAALAAAHAELFVANNDAAQAKFLISRTLGRLTDATFVYEALLKFARFASVRDARTAHQLLQAATGRKDTVREIHAFLVEAIVLRNDGDSTASRSRALRARQESSALGLLSLEAIACEYLDDRERAIALYETMGASRCVRRLSGKPAVRNGPATATLTLREREIALLVAQGLSNRAIGERLSRSDRTIEHHIGSIFSKLSLQTRAELAAFVSSSAATV